MADAARVVKELQTERVEILQAPVTETNPCGIVVNPETFGVSKAQDPNKLQVEWICAWSPFEIQFKSASPFSDSRYSSHKDPRGWVALSGRVREDVQEDHQKPPDHRKNYEYSVVIGGRVCDPGGVVNP